MGSAANHAKGLKHKSESESTNGPTTAESVGVIAFLSLALKLMLLPSSLSLEFTRQKAWMSTTLYKPIATWYNDSSTDFPSVFTELAPMDCAPGFALFKASWAHLISFIDPSLIPPPEDLNLAVSTQKEYNLAVFQRVSVIISEQLMLLGVLLYCTTWPSITTTDMEWSRNKVVVVVALTLFNPGMLLVDHVYLHYTGCTVGLLLIAVAFLRRGDDIGDLLGAAALVVLVMFDHTLIPSVVPLILVYLFRHYASWPLHTQSASAIIRVRAPTSASDGGFTSDGGWSSDDGHEEDDEGCNSIASVNSGSGSSSDDVEVEHSNVVTFAQKRSLCIQTSEFRRNNSSKSDHQLRDSRENDLSKIEAHVQRGQGEDKTEESIHESILTALSTTITKSKGDSDKQMSAVLGTMSHLSRRPVISKSYQNLPSLSSRYTEPEASRNTAMSVSPTSAPWSTPAGFEALDKNSTSRITKHRRAHQRAQSEIPSGMRLQAAYEQFKKDSGFRQLLARPRARSSFEFTTSGRRVSLRRLASLLTVLMISIMAYMAPFIVGGVTPWQLVQTLFNRLTTAWKLPGGVCQPYWAPNIWALYKGLDRILYIFNTQVELFEMPEGVNIICSFDDSGSCPFLILPEIHPLFCVALMAIAMFPALRVVWDLPHQAVLMPVLVYLMTCSFMLGYHVHEISVMLIILPLTITSCDSTMDARLYLLMSWIAHMSLLPVIKTTDLKAIKPVLLLLHCFGSFIALDQYHIMARRARRIRAEPNGGGVWLRNSDRMYFVGLAAVYLCTEVVSPIISFIRIDPSSFTMSTALGDMSSLPAQLDLFLVSIYCAVGLVHSWMLAYRQVTRKVALIESYQWSPKGPKPFHHLRSEAGHVARPPPIRRFMDLNN